MSETLERLEQLWRIGPIDASLATRYAAALMHAARPARARAVLVEAMRAGLDVATLAALAARLGCDRWSGSRGSAPMRTWLAPAPPRVEAGWRFVSSWRDDRFGRPPAARPDRIVLVAQSVVVGMRFVRLVALSTRTGDVVWEAERRDLLHCTGPTWLGGLDRPEAVGWGYVVSDGDDALLCLERLDPHSGAPLGCSQRRLAGATVERADSALYPLSAEVLGWGVRWVDAARHHAIFLIDRDRGTFRQAALPSLAPESLAAVGSKVFGIDDAGLVVLEGGARRVLRPFPSLEVGEVVEGDAPRREVVATCDGLYLLEPVYRPQPPSGRVLVRQNQPVFIPLDAAGEAGAPVSLDARGDHWRYLCAAPDGEVFALRRARGEDGGAVVALRQAGAPRRVIELAGHRRDVAPEACWMGGALVVRTAARGEEPGSLRCLDPRDGQERWALTLDGSWHQGPVPAGEGLAAIQGQGVSWLRASGGEPAAS